MAKGENLEKPKKGGMVIVIGVGKPTKPKKGDLKKSGPRRRGGGAASNRSRKVQMKERMEEDPNYLQRQFERFNVNEDFMNKYFEHHHGKSLDEAIDDDNINIIESMKEARRMKAANEGHDPKNAGLRRLLENRGISFSQLRESLDEDPFMEWSDRIDSLTDDDHVEEQRNRSRGGGRGFAPTREGQPSSRNNEEGEPRDRRAQLRRMGLGPHEIEEQLEHDRLLEEEQAYRERDEGRGYGKKKTADANDEDPDAMFDRLTRLFENRGYRNPMQAAFEAMQGTPQGSELGGSAHDPEEDAYSDTYAPYSVRNEPSTEFTVPFAGGGQMADRDLVGRHSPRGSVEAQFYGFRGAGPIHSSNRRQIEDQEADMDAVEADMYGLKRTSSDSTNVMDEAWALLKGNPSMRDAEGRAINNPAAMVYDDLAHQVYMNEIGPTDRIDDPDDETAADRMEQMRNLTHQGKLVRRLKQGKTVSPFDVRMATRNDRAEQNRLRRMREDARRQTRHTMEFGNLPTTPSPNYGMQSQREADTDVQMKPGNIMDHM